MSKEAGIIIYKPDAVRNVVGINNLIVERKFYILESYIFSKFVENVWAFYSEHYGTEKESIVRRHLELTEKKYGNVGGLLIVTNALGNTRERLVELKKSIRELDMYCIREGENVYPFNMVHTPNSDDKNYDSYIEGVRENPKFIKCRETDIFSKKRKN